MRVRYLFSSRRTGQIQGGNKHRQPFPHIVREVVRTSDIILEILDARFVEKTRNKELEKYILDQGKKIIFVLNKSDLINLSELRKNVDLSELHPFVLFSCKSKIGRRNLRQRIKIEVKKLKLDIKARIGVVGYPNTGKSSLINLLAGRKVAPIAAEAGFTKGMQKIRFNKDIVILDTPGIIPDDESLERKKSEVKKHAEIGVRTYDKVKEPDFIFSKMMEENPGLFEKFYNIDSEGDSELFLEKLGRKMNLITKGNKVDVDRTARWIIKDWQEGKIKIHNNQ